MYCVSENKAELSWVELYRRRKKRHAQLLNHANNGTSSPLRQTFYWIIDVLSDERRATTRYACIRLVHCQRSSDRSHRCLSITACNELAFDTDTAVFSSFIRQFTVDISHAKQPTSTTRVGTNSLNHHRLSVIKW